MNIQEISSLEHRFVKHAVKLRKEGAYRRQEGQVLLIGEKMCCEVGQKKELLSLIVENGRDIPSDLNVKQLYSVTDSVFKKITGLKNSEGIAAIVPLPEMSSLGEKKRLLALDQISDPGNLGTLVRTALAFGFDGVFIIKGSVDPFNDKAIVASKGACFFLPLYMGTREELIGYIREQKFLALLADMDGMPLEQLEVKEPFVLIMSHESKGAHESLFEMSTRVTIPMTKNIDSLNVAVAGGIMMYHMRLILA